MDQKSVLSKSIALLAGIVFILLTASFTEAQTVTCSCDTCHGNPPVANTIGGPDGLVGGIGTSSGAHDHFTKLLQNLNCENCHFSGMPLGHQDNKLQIGFYINGKDGTGATYDGLPSFANPSYSYGATNNTMVTLNGSLKCSNVYCHGGGIGGTNNVGTSGPFPMSDPRPIEPSISPSWYNVAPIGCAYCHGFPPSYVESQYKKSNSHLVPDHARQTCDVCHYATTRDNVTISDVTKHHNGLYDVVPNPNATYLGSPVNFMYTYDPGGGRCDNVSCHPGITNTNVWGNAHPIVPISQSPGTGCYEVRFGVMALAGSCTWNFGDYHTSNDCVPPPHMYASKGPYAVSVTGRDTNWHPFTSTTVINPSPVNVNPAASSTASVNGYTVTFTVTASDPDAYSCGHAGDGTITVTWGEYVDTKTVTLTTAPSDTVFTRTFTTPVTGLVISGRVTDNAGGVKLTNATVDVPTKYSISGTVTHGNPATGLANVTMILRLVSSNTTKATTKTAADGTYSFNNFIPDVYRVIPSLSGETFSPANQTVTIGPDATGVDFFGTP